MRTVFFLAWCWDLYILPIVFVNTGVQSKSGSLSGSAFWGRGQILPKTNPAHYLKPELKADTGGLKKKRLV
jgi:hypothetical protein